MVGQSVVEAVLGFGHAVAAGAALLLLWKTLSSQPSLLDSKAIPVLTPSLLPATGFNPEQVAMVDLLVLSEASAVVGHCWSTFSWFVREQRALSGLSKETFRFVDHPHCSKPGTKHYPYFHGGLDFV